MEARERTPRTDRSPNGGARQSMESTSRGTGIQRATGRGTGIQRATGRSREEWSALLDEWGAPGRPYRAIADWLVGEHGLSSWWAQKIIVEYEEARGLRPPGVRRDGTFSVGASKTVAVPVDRLFRAFVDTRIRARWLPGAGLRKGPSHPGRSATFEWEGGPSRVRVEFTARGPDKSEVAVEHQRLADAGAARELKAYWRERLVALKAALEG